MKQQNNKEEIEKPKGWANLQQQLKEVREESFKQGVWKGQQDKEKEMLDKFGKMIEEMDIQLFLEDVVDKKTKKKIEIPKEILDLWNIYWEHIKEKILQKLKGDSNDKKQ